MISVPIQPLSNQEIIFQYQDFTYTIILKTVKDATISSIKINDVDEINGLLVNPFSNLMPYTAGNNFIFTTQNNELINYENFNNTQELFFLEDGVDI